MGLHLVVGKRGSGDGSSVVGKSGVSSNSRGGYSVSGVSDSGNS